MASSALNAMSLGIQVAGQNLTNANTPGYVREVLNLQTAGTLKSQGGVPIGTGVSINSVTQIVDKFLEERLRGATSDFMSSATQSYYYSQLEATMNELTDTDLSTLLTTFFNSISNVQNQPENLIFRQMVAESGLQVTNWLNQMSDIFVSMEMDINKRVESACDQINLLTSQIQKLNENIARFESGHNSVQAVGLRDQRLEALNQLAMLVNIRTVEDAQTGMVSVSCGGSVLVSGSVRNEVTVGYQSVNSQTTSGFLYVGDNKLDVRSGEVFGYYEARDQIISGTLDELNQFASQLVLEFNKIYCGGQGLTGYTQLASSIAVTGPDTPLNLAGLSPPPVSGQFNFLVTNSQGITTEHTIDIALRAPKTSDPFSLKAAPIQDGTTLRDVAESINAIDGVVAYVDSRNRLVIESESPGLQFSFANDTSGFLSTMGINTFFTGQDAGTISISQLVLKDPSKFAASGSGPGKDTAIAQLLAGMPEKKLSELGNRSITEVYKTLTSGVSLAGGTTKAIRNADLAHQQSLSAQRDAISGVNIDDETVMLLTYQRSYQASAKYIGVINAMLDALINL